MRGLCEQEMVIQIRVMGASYANANENEELVNGYQSLAADPS